MRCVEADLEKRRALFKAAALAAIPFLIVALVSYCWGASFQKIGDPQLDDIVAFHWRSLWLNICIGLWALCVTGFTYYKILPLCTDTISSRTWPPNYKPIALREKAREGTAAVFMGYLVLAMPLFVLAQAIGAFVGAYQNYEWIHILNDI